MSAKVLIVYDSSHGLVEDMARQVASGVRAAGLTAVVENVEACAPEDLLKYEALILGSPCYFAGPSAPMKRFLDRTYDLRGRLEGKVGAAFSASDHIGGGNELTVRALLDAMLVHGMIIQGDPVGDPFGAIALREGEGEVVTDLDGECQRLGRRVAQLVQRIGG